jgi:hypothetical protein
MGIEVTGPRATPPVPKVPTITEMLNGVFSREPEFDASTSLAPQNPLSALDAQLAQLRNNPEAGFLSPKMLPDIGAILFTPRLYMILKRLGMQPSEFVERARFNPRLSELGRILGAPGNDDMQTEQEIAALLGAK